MPNLNIDKSCSVTGKMRLSLQQVFLAYKARVHPAVQLYIWICLVIAAQFLNIKVMIPLCLVLIILSSRVSDGKFAQLLRKTRWILLAVFVIYAYTTPGEFLWVGLGVFSPVSEGVLQGALQAARLIMVLAGLAILLTQLTQSKLVKGLYAWLSPLALLGLPVHRVAVRLALTLDYAEHAMHDAAKNWRGNIERMLELGTEKSGIIELEVESLSKRDFLLVGLISLALLGVLI
jgi:energy-coupling factor transporter transmembrane protein EcfT